MKKLLILFLLISSEGMANCYELNKIYENRPPENYSHNLVYRCVDEMAICTYSAVKGGYSVSCFPKSKLK